MKNVREQIIDWTKRHQIKGHRYADGIRHSALLDGEFRLIVAYDPLAPESDAMMMLPLRALPYQRGERAKALQAMLRLNHELIAKQLFSASLCHYEEGEWICLLASAPAISADRHTFESLFSQYLNMARWAKQHLAIRPQAPPPQDSLVRYL